MSIIVPAFMPPLLPEEFDTEFDRKNSDTVFIGEAAEHIVAKYFLKNKINFGKPLVDQGTDWWVQGDDPRKIERAQVKKVAWKAKIDTGLRNRRGIEVRRDTFDFRFQSSGSKTDPSKCFYGPESIDVFYHVLVTPLREMIWKIPANLVPVDQMGWFVQSKSPVLDRSFKVRKKPDFQIRDMLISCMYDVRLIEAYPDFFFPQKQTVMEFFE